MNPGIKKRRIPKKQTSPIQTMRSILISLLLLVHTNAAAFTAVKMTQAMSCADEIFTMVENVQNSNMEPSEETVLSKLEIALIKCSDGKTTLDRNLFKLSENEKKNVHRVNLYDAVLHLSSDTDYAELKNEDVSKEVAALVQRFEKLSHDHTKEIALLETGAKVKGWAAYTKVAVWAGGIVLAVPTCGASLGIAVGVNLGVGATDVGIKTYNGDSTGASLAAGSMLLGAIVPGSGVVAEATFDISSEIAIDMLVENADVAEDLTENSIDFVQGQGVGGVYDKATEGLQDQNNALRFQRIRARRARGEEDAEQTTEANLMSLKDYRNYVEIENKILARRKSHPCYFAMLVRRDQYDGELPRALRQLRKTNQRERSLLEMFDEYQDDIQDSSEIAETFDEKFSKCRGTRTQR